MRHAFVLLLVLLIASGSALAQQGPSLRSYFADPAKVREGGVKMVPIHTAKGDFKVVVEGDPALFNPYGVMLISPEKCPSVKAAQGQAFIDWLTGAEGQAAIAGFRLGGAQQFFPSAAVEKVGG